MAKKPEKKAAVVSAVTLAAIVAATLDESKGFLFAPESVYAPLVSAGFVEVNPELKNDAGDLATRATESGIAYVNDEVPGNKPVETVAVGAFVLETGVAIPKSKRGRSGDLYPFDKMEVGHSFFVAATESKPNPAKSLASTVSSATARYAVPGEGTKTNRKGETVPVMVETRKFAVRAVEENGVKGARIWRTM